MNAFFDTSALVKFFHVEDGTDQVTSIIQDNANQIWVSELARVELLSAIYKKHRANVLNSADLETAIAGFDSALAQFHMEPIGSAVADQAERLIKLYGKNPGLRTLDALQMASFILVAETDWVFVCSDNTLCQAIEQECHQIMNPVA